MLGQRLSTPTRNINNHEVHYEFSHDATKDYRLWNMVVNILVQVKI